MATEGDTAPMETSQSGNSSDMTDVENVKDNVKIEENIDGKDSVKDEVKDNGNDNEKAVLKDDEQDNVKDAVKDDDKDNAKDAVKIERNDSEEDKIENDAEPKNDDDLNDPYGYIKRDEFTTEIFKIEIGNIPKIYSWSQLKMKLKKLGLNPVKIILLQDSSYAFANFRCEEDRQKAIEVIDGHNWKGLSLTAKPAKPRQDPLIKRKLDKEKSEAGPAKRSRPNDKEELSDEERLKKAVMPLGHLTYDEQLKVKLSQMQEHMKNLTKQMFKNFPHLKKKDSWLANLVSANSGMCCPLEEILPSPECEEYRNKNEFTIGLSPQGKENTVGFRLSSYRDGDSSVAEPYGCVMLNQKMKDVVQGFQEFIRISGKDCYKTEVHSGHWRLLQVRTTRKNEVMAIIGFHPQSLTKEEMLALKQSIKEHFTDGDGKKCGITSMYLQQQTSRVSAMSSEEEYEHIFGEEHIHESLCDMTFRISPDAFFQVNTAGAEVLYRKVADWAGISPETTLLDVCCGTGTIGLTLAKKVKHVKGFEMCQQAIEDAKFNATLNDIKNAEFYCGKAEDVMMDVVKYLPGSSEVVAIVDPPRQGLHSRVVLAIRRCHNLKKLIYVSCNPKGASGNILDLMRPVSKKFKNAPFRLVKAVPVDMFPYTNHCELIMLLERDST